MKRPFLVAIVLLVVIAVGAIAFMSLGMQDDRPEPPGVPLNVEATAGEGEVFLEWDAPTTEGSSEIAGYNVYRLNTIDPDDPAEKRTTTGTELTWTDLEGEVEYFFCVSASNEDEEGPRSSGVAVITLRIVIVPNATDMVLDEDEIGVEYDLDVTGTERPADLIPRGLRSYVASEFMVDMADPLNNWRFVMIEICVCETPEEAAELYAYLFNTSISADPSSYDGIGIGNDSRFYTEYTLTGIVFDGWFIQGSTVVHMEFDSSSYVPVATENWFQDLMAEQSEKVIANSFI